VDLERVSERIEQWCMQRKHDVLAYSSPDESTHGRWLIVVAGGADITEMEKDFVGTLSGTGIGVDDVKFLNAPPSDRALDD
jgi:hypothetical protein